MVRLYSRLNIIFYNIDIRYIYLINIFLKFKFINWIYIRVFNEIESIEYVECIN